MLAWSVRGTFKAGHLFIPTLSVARFPKKLGEFVRASCNYGQTSFSGNACHGPKDVAVRSMSFTSKDSGKVF